MSSSPARGSVFMGKEQWTGVAGWHVESSLRAERISIEKNESDRERKGHLFSQEINTLDEMDLQRAAGWHETEHRKTDIGRTAGLTPRTVA